MSRRGPHLAAYDRDASALARGQLGTTMLIPARAPGPTDHQDRRCGWSMIILIVRMWNVSTSSTASTRTGNLQATIPTALNKAHVTHLRK